MGQGVAGSCGVGHKMWLGWSVAVAVAVALVGTVASIRRLAWELPFAVALKKTNKKTNKKKEIIKTVIHPRAVCHSEN